jgi:hypothetical protein
MPHLEFAMSTKRPGSLIKPTSAIAIRPRPLGHSDVAIVRHAVASIAPDWSVELEGISGQEATLVLCPADGDDTHGPSFTISREAGGFRVDQVHWDAPTEIGVFSSLTDVVATLRVRLAFCLGGTPPASVTLH